MDFAPVARALAARGLALSMTGYHPVPQVRTGGAVILWQSVDDPTAWAQAFDQGVSEVVGPWMHEGETVARIMRLAMRVPAAPARLELGKLAIDLVGRTVERAGRPVAVLAREYALLVYLARRCGAAVSRRELLSAVWSLDFDPGTNSVEVHMSRLRAKLDRGFGHAMLHTVKGQGYMLAPEGAGSLMVP